jgi:cyclopropane fatty-acyl-phospholipid synthase-like methyltransferase
MHKPFSPACERNQSAILDVLRERFADRHRVLEVGSGTGQHAVHFALALPLLVWQTSDVPAHLGGIAQWLAEAGLPNTPAPLAFDINGAPPARRYDAVFSANTLHIMSWAEVQRLFALLPALMSERALLTVYGPFNRGGQFTSASNAAFDASLRIDHPQRGIRDVGAVDALARTAGLALLEDRAMPANNRCITWQLAP